MTITEHHRPEELPGLNCGVCGFRECADLAARLDERPDLIRRCVHLSRDRIQADARDRTRPAAETRRCAGCATPIAAAPEAAAGETKLDSLGREFDFFLEHFPEDPGPREIIIPHNPILTRELEIAVGDTLIGRPLGMSCGCPITHCGVVRSVDLKTGVIVWCVTGPLEPRRNGYKDLGYYIAEGYEGLATEARVPLSIGMRYYFQPRMCMLQWRHSGLINFLNRVGSTVQVRLEGLWIG